ncbi:transposase [Streptomyces chartreusis]
MTTAVRSRTMLTLTEVCEELAVSRSTFYDWRAKAPCAALHQAPERRPPDPAERPRSLARRP